MSVLPATAAELRSRTESELARAENARDAFVGLGSGASFSEAIEAFDRVRRPLDAARGVVSLFVQVHPLAEMRAAAVELEQRLASFETALALDRAVFDRLVALDPARADDSLELRLWQRAVRDLRRSGVDRDETVRARIRGLSEELVKLSQAYELNVIQGGKTLEIEGGHAGLAGLPSDFLAAHPCDERGVARITTDPQDYQPVMSYAEDEELRRRLYFASLSRAAPQNLDVLRQILALRHEYAGLLGYPSWADYSLEDKMVESTARAREFIERCAALASPRMEAERAELLEVKRRLQPGADAVHDWDRFYLAERVKSERFGFDSRQVRPFFAFESVKRGVLATTSALFGLEFERSPLAGWHPSVEAWDVIDAGRRVARLWFDLHARDSKYKHAAMFHLQSGVAGERLPEGVLVCNFPEPKAGDPGLCLHSEVTTFFHEFGHLLHHVLGGGQRFLWFSGIACEHDFVEVPSQLYEEWAWDAGVLQRFARHHHTGEPIPRELIEGLRAAEEYGKGLHVRQQMYYAALSLDLHACDPRELDLETLVRATKSRWAPLPFEPGTHMAASFGHLVGYGAGYYTYMWSLIIAKDCLSGFADDLMDPLVAQRFRRAILEPGGSRDAGELVSSFLGRRYAYEAWADWLNE